MEQKDPKITDENVTVTANSATFNWTVEWVGKRISVVELSQHEDMSDSQFYGSEEELNKSEFVVTAHDLTPNTKYYYRFWVWNQSYVDNRFVMGTKWFTTTNEGVSHDDAISGKYSVNSLGRQVWFSKGNLQYQASTNIWRFAEHQWDYVGYTDAQNFHYGTVAESSNELISSTYSGWIDLFGWGTSGYDHGAGCYQPWSTSTSYEKYYAYGNYERNLFNGSGKADWGYNPISNGGNTEGQWRTLTNSEWEYILTKRNTPSGIRYAFAKVNNTPGMILLPDDWNADLFALEHTNEYSQLSFEHNIIDEYHWNVMENAGVVFLPAAGSRSGSIAGSAKTRGCYWTSNYANSDSYSYDWKRKHAFSFVFGDYYTDPLIVGVWSRNTGFSVRLVCNVE